MRKCPSGRRRQSGAVRGFQLENQRRHSEANTVDGHLTLCHIMANQTVVRVVIAGLWNVSRDG